MKKWLIIGITCLIILGIVIFGVVYFVNKNDTTKLEPSSQRELANDLNENLQIVSTSVNTQEEKASPNAILNFETYYKKCEHIKNKKEEIGQALVNNTQSQFQERYKDWEIVEFTPNNITLRKEEEGICNEHFILRQRNGYIAVYIEDEEGNETLKQMTAVVVTYLPEIDLNKLKDGIKVYGIDNLNARLEDYE